jgi:hypothetical protein
MDTLRSYLCLEERPTLSDKNGFLGFAFKHSLYGDELGSRVIASDETGYVALLRDWLYDRNNASKSRKPPRARFAPSIILRSEAELFGVSTPRFAVRIYFGKYGFVNCRRLRQLAEEILFCHQGHGVDPDLKKRLSAENWIADSLLQPPHDLVTERYRFLSVDLARAYGEKGPRVGVPFVTHIRHGGGMCAQASCFMVMALLHKRVNPIGGVADLTVLANRERLAGPVVRKGRLGLSPRKIVDLFRRRVRGVNAHLETVNPNDTEIWPDAYTRVNIALQSHLCSGFPAIAFVSLSRMFGYQTLHGASADPILIPGVKDYQTKKRNAIPLKGLQSIDQKKRLAHTVVVVGWKPDSDEFILNDPATYPFIPATARQLVDARQYRKRTQAERDEDKRAGKKRELSEDMLPGVSLITFTPKSVRLPLLNYLSRRDKELKTHKKKLFEISGLFDHAEMVQAGGMSTPWGLKYGIHYVDQPVRLIKVSAATEALDMPSLKSDKSDAEAARIAADLVKNQQLRPDWYWVQHIPNADMDDKTLETLWFWKTRDSRTYHSCDLVAVILARTPSDSSWQLLYLQPPPSP